MAKQAKATKGKGADVKTARFSKLASKRTQQVLTKIRVLGNCSNRSSYFYTVAQVEKIFGAIQDALDAAKARYSAAPTEKENAPSFTV